jgi:hypothetical protein
MNRSIICLLLLTGIFFGLQAQDKIVLRNGRAIEVKVHRSLESRVEYTYPGETSIYERPKSAISYILYENGKKEICDESLRESERNSSARTTTTPDRTTSSRVQSSSNRNNELSGNDDIFWQDVKTTFNESDVKGMTRLNRVSAISRATYKDAVQQLKKKAADMGGTAVLIMDIPESDNGDQIEVMGIAYREEGMSYSQKNANERNNDPAESSSNIRRRRIAQQMESYNNNSDLVYEDNSSRNTNASSSKSNTKPAREDYVEEAPDAIYLTNGRIIKGTIEEFEPDDFVSIRTTTGRIYEYSMDDVKKVSRLANGKSSARSSSQRSSSRNENNDNRSKSSSKNNDSYSISGYKGTVDVGYNLAMGGTGSKGSFEFNTSHGYQLNEYLFVGAGVGFHMFSARDVQLKTNMSTTDKFPQYVPKPGTTTIDDSVTYMHAVDSSYMTLPLFLDIRGYYPIKNSAITPFAMFRAGYAFNLSDGFGGMGLYMNPAVGVKFQIAPMIGINFSIGYSYQSYGGIPKNGGYGYYYIKDATKTKYEAKGSGGISLKLGVEF